MKNKILSTVSIIFSAAVLGCGNSGTCTSCADIISHNGVTVTDICEQQGPTFLYVPYSKTKRQWQDPTSLLPSISDYDNIIRDIARSKGYDWRFISAIACAESRFDENCVSKVGARGLMQIMPIVARQFGVPDTVITDPSTNVRLGVELLNHISGNLKFSTSTSYEDRISIILAAYNCGMGHVRDARRLALSQGENPDSWPVVAMYLKLKFNPEYYMDDVVKFGQFEDSEQTVTFVNRVLKNYDVYCQSIPL